jgi:hypothetical protein
VIRCEICNREIDPADETNWDLVRGFQRRSHIRAPGKHGGRDIALVEHAGGIAHHQCVRLRQSGFDPAQLELA